MTSRHVATAALGAVALVAAFGRMSTLVSPTPDGIPWQVVLVGAAALGVAGTLLGRLMRIGLVGTVAFTAAITVVVLGRTADAPSMVGGVLPTGATWDAIGAMLATGLEYLRYATSPVYPDPGFVLLLVPVSVGVGAAWAWLVGDGRTGSAAAVPAGFFVAVAMADQAPTNPWWLVGAVVWTTALLVARGLEDAATLPRLLGPLPNRPAAVLGVVVVALGLVVADAGAGAAPGAGAMAWVDGSGLGGLRRGISVNLFASVVQSDLVNDSEEVAFRAVVSGTTLPRDRLYWRLITLDRYDGRTWRPTFDDGDSGFEPPELRFAGRTETVTQTVQLDGLRQQLLPTLYSPVAVSGESPLIRNGVRPRHDGALDLGGLRTARGLTYEVVSEVPVAGLTELALAGGSGLPPLLEEAQRRGLVTPSAGVAVVDHELPDPDRYLALPSGLDGRIAGLARDLTRGTTDPLERMVLLESFFRIPGAFTYDIDITPGHAAQDLAAWLFEDDSPNHRTGYCEQFATALAVMGRTVGIPTRVVIGFSPGEVSGDGVITVRGRNAHAWVEAWVDGAGWVRFDPTPRSEADNPATGSELAFALADVIPPDQDNPLTGLDGDGAPFLVDPSRFDDFAELQDDTFDFDGILGGLPDGAAPAGAGAGALWWAVAAAGAVGAVPAAKWLRSRRRLALAGAGDVSAAWAEIIDRLRDLDHPIDPSMTPAEIAASVGPELGPLADAHGRARWSGRRLDAGNTGEALASFTATDTVLRERSDLGRRLLALWSPRSLRR